MYSHGTVAARVARGKTATERVDELLAPRLQEDPRDVLILALGNVPRAHLRDLGARRLGEMEPN
eukprot:10613304-Lingulodinium_polyedra.AAC.1